MARQAPPLSDILPLLRQSLAAGETPALQVSSNSMSPLLWAGDQIVLAQATAAQLEPGDIVTLATAKGLLTHRFWGLQDGKLLTRGDRALQTDPLWAAEALLGRVVGRRRSERQLSFQQGRGQWLAQGVQGLTAVEQTLLTRFPQASWLPPTHRLFFAMRWGLTAVLR